MSEIGRITLVFASRKDGGLLLWSPELPGLVLSNSDPFLVIADISPALKVFYEEWRKGKVTR